MLNKHNSCYLHQPLNLISNKSYKGHWFVRLDFCSWSTFQKGLFYVENKILYIFVQDLKSYLYDVLQFTLFLFWLLLLLLLLWSLFFKLNRANRSQLKVVCTLNRHLIVIQPAVILQLYQASGQVFFQRFLSFELSLTGYYLIIKKTNLTFFQLYQFVFISCIFNTLNWFA